MVPLAEKNLPYCSVRTAGMLLSPDSWLKSLCLEHSSAFFFPSLSSSSLPSQRWLYHEEILTIFYKITTTPKGPVVHPYFISHHSTWGNLHIFMLFCWLSPFLQWLCEGMVLCLLLFTAMSLGLEQILGPERCPINTCLVNDWRHILGNIILGCSVKMVKGR